MKKITKRLITLFLSVLMLVTSFVFTAPAQAKSGTGLSLKRQTVIEEMKKMSIARWKPAKTYKTYHYYSPGSDATYKLWTKGRNYYGIPYSQNRTIVNPINNRICVTYKVYEGSLSSKKTLSRELGRNDCSSSCVMALQTVDKKIGLTYTSQMRPGVNNLVAVGKYTYYGNKATTNQKNGSAVMYACYAKLKPGDLLIRDGHAMMVVGVDTANKVVTVVHQTGLDKHYNPETDTSRNPYSYADTNSTWGVNDKMSFYYVWSNGYIPLASKTLKEDDAKKHDVTMCAKVGKVSVTETTTTSVSLSWDKVSGATSYEIYAFTGSEYVKIGETKKTSYTADNLYSAKNYRFAVKSCMKYDGKKYTNIDFSFVSTATTPKKVKDVSAKLNKKGTSASLSWQKTTRAENYYVYQATKKDGKYKFIGTTEGKTTFTAAELSKDKTYYYKVKAVVYYNGGKAFGELSKPVKAS